MVSLCSLGPGDTVFVRCSHPDFQFYAPFLAGEYTVASAEASQNRARLDGDRVTGLKIFANQRGTACVVEHEYDQFGESTWCEKSQRHRWLFVPIDLYVKARAPQTRH